MAQGTRQVKGTFLQGLIRLFERGWFAPFLLAVQPVLHLFSINITEVNFPETLRAIVASLVVAAIALGLAHLLSRDWLKANTVASLFIALFFLFGDVSGWTVKRFGLGPARADLLILCLMAVGMLLWIWLVQRRSKSMASINLYFNLLSILLLIRAGIPLASDVLQNGVSFHQDAPMPVEVVQSEHSRPDIYYIILDGYGRQDILQAYYEFDNSEFLRMLEARGFYVANQSSSNYMQTMLSLSSSFNMDYLQSLEASGVEIENRLDLFELLKGSQVRDVLAQNGYQLVSFRNAYHATIPNAEIYYDDAEAGLTYPITAFESIVIDHTLARVLVHVPVFNKALVEMPYDTHRIQILSTFSRLQEIPALAGDYFVYAHIIAPHPPFVFNEKGEPLPHGEPFTLADGNSYIKNHSRKNYIVGYRNQIKYVNKLVLETIDAILARSETPPIIIIQGDHGPGANLHFGLLTKTVPAERFGILNAYYFPDHDYTFLYPSISPVNSFRVIGNQFFGEDYPLLPDRHYYSTWGEPFDFIEVTDLSLP